MKRQELKDLSDIYQREEDFSEDLAENLDILDFGVFQDVDCEVVTMNRSADIVGRRDNDVLVVENQFGDADYKHWGRLEAYARFNDATIAVLVAEGFEDLMVQTCIQRNLESDIRWYLPLARVNSHDELYFNHVVDPGLGGALDELESGESEFWAPIRQDRSSVFSGKPVPERHDGFIYKQVRGIRVFLILRTTYCAVKLSFRGDNREERREEVMELFPRLEYSYDYMEAGGSVSAQFAKIDGGKRNPELWADARRKLVEMGTRIYNRISESDL